MKGVPRALGRLLSTGITGLIGLSALLVAQPSSCYEQATHAAVTRQAFVRARLNPAASDLAWRLGLQDQQHWLGRTYIDITPTDPIARDASPRDAPNFSAQKIKLVNDRDSAFQPALESLPGWLMLGAIREDDVPLDPKALENNPQDEPGGSFERVFRHFFDPYGNRGLAATWTSAPDWALVPTVDGSRNHFAVTHAREAMWRALTLKKIEPSGALSDLVASADLPVYADMYLWELRLAYWATTFRALGDVLHLLQDMAQPQHTRNDPHSGLGCVTSSCLGGHASYYEKFVDARATGANQFRLRERFFKGFMTQEAIEDVPTKDLAYGGYPNTSFDSYRDFFATATGAGSVNGRGLANYSNQGFFTAGTNIDNFGGGFPSPPWATGSLQEEAVSSLTDASGGKVEGSTIFKVGTVQDHYDSNQTTAGVRLSTFGAFDQFMRPAGKRQFALNHYNYEDQARLLIPRAVAYSAGFLDYFFRGQLEIGLPAAGAFAVVDHTQQGCWTVCGFPALRLKVKNATSSESISDGFFVAVVKYFRNQDYSSDLSGEPGGPNFTGYDARSSWEEIVVSDKVDISMIPGGRLDSGADAEIQFSFPQRIPITATDVYLQVVFRGRLGNEADAVIVETKNISEPNYVAIVNDLDYRYDGATDSFQPTDPATTPQTITNIDIKLGGATTPIATLPQLGVRRYAQLAFLTDLGTDATERLVIDFSAPGMSSPLTFANFPIATFVSPGQGVYQRSRWVSSYRGMWSDYRFDVFSGYVYGLAPCAPGDARRICTSAGLTAIPASNAVAWSIHFP